MKKKRLIIIVLMLAVLCALGAFFFLGGRGPLVSGSLRLWYLEQDADSGLLEELAAEYNAQLKKGLMSVELCAFENEDALGEAFYNTRPDLLWCGQLKAAQLDGRTTLPQVSLNEGKSRFKNGEGGEKASFFPYGSRVPLLVTDSARLPTAQRSLEDFLAAATEYSRAEGKPFFASESYTVLLSFALNSLGEEYPDGESYVRLHNLLARCGYDGVLSYPEAEPLAAVMEGRIPAAVVTGSRLRDLGAGLSVTTLPIPEGGRAVYPAELMGLTLLCNEGYKHKSAAAFIAWLNADSRPAKIALRSGLVPLSDPGNITAEGPLQELLLGLCRDGSLQIISPDGSYAANYEADEKEFRLGLEFLSGAAPKNN